MITKLNSKFPSFSQAEASGTATASDFVNLIKGRSTGDTVLFRINTDVASFLFGSTSSYGGVAIVMKASSNNAYFLWFTRGAATIGNISLTDGSVSARTQLT